MAWFAGNTKSQVESDKKSTGQGHEDIKTINATGNTRNFSEPVKNLEMM